MKKQIYSGIYELPAALASEQLTEGCIVLEGGAFRGVYTSGVLDALMEADLNFQCTVGVSAGAMNGMNYVSGQIGRSGRINLRYRHDSRYVGFHAIRRNHGLIGFDFVFGQMESVPPFNRQRFDDPRREFYAVVTNLKTAKPEFIGKDSGSSIYQAVRASASMPYISQPVMIRQNPCLDGGCSVNIPYQWALDRGFRHIVIIKTRPEGFRKPVKSHDFHGHSREDFYRRSYPEFADVLRQGDVRYNQECDAVDALAASGRIFVIAPSQKITVSRLEPDMEKLGKLYDLGYQDGKREIARLRAYLKGENIT